jgi:hypothetical protein
MFDAEHKEELEDGKVLLYTRNGIFQARVYKGNRQYINRSLKTHKLDDARKLAVKFLHEIEFRQKEQLPLQQRSFGDVIPTLELLKGAVLDGELDTQIEVAANKLRDGFGG